MSPDRESSTTTPRRRGRVPVTSRDNAPAEPRKRRPTTRLGAGDLAVLGVVSLVVLGAVWTPATNYFQGRTEIARVTAAIEQKERRVDELNAQLERYDSDAYVREQARRRLGVIAPGETAYRIMDPRMDNAPHTASDGEDARPDGWLAALWDSVSRPAEETDSLDGGEVDTHMPITGDQDGQDGDRAGQ